MWAEICEQEPTYINTVKPVLSGHSKKAIIVFKTDYRLMQVKSIAECSNWEHSVILLTFIKLPFAIDIFALSPFEWPLKTGLTVSYVVIILYGERKGHYLENSPI